MILWLIVGLFCYQISFKYLGVPTGKPTVGSVSLSVLYMLQKTSEWHFPKGYGIKTLLLLSTTQSPGITLRDITVTKTTVPMHLQMRLPSLLLRETSIGIFFGSNCSEKHGPDSPERLQLSLGGNLEIDQLSSGTPSYLCLILLSHINDGTAAKKTIANVVLPIGRVHGSGVKPTILISDDRKTDRLQPHDSHNFNVDLGNRAHTMILKTSCLLLCQSSLVLC